MNKLRSPEHTRALLGTPKSQRFERSSIENFQARGTFVQDYKYWYLTMNEFPFSDYKDQMILWSKSKLESESVKHPMALQELADIIEEYTSNGFYVSFSGSPKSKTRRYHIYFYRLKGY